MVRVLPPTVSVSLSGAWIAISLAASTVHFFVMVSLSSPPLTSVVRLPSTVMVSSFFTLTLRLSPTLMLCVAPTDIVCAFSTVSFRSFWACRMICSDPALSSNVSSL